MNNHDLRESVKCLLNFLDSRECGESYWVDDEGRQHNADIGYVSEFLEDLRLYLNGEWKDPQNNNLGTRMFNYSVQYRMIDDQSYSEIWCESINHIRYANGDPGLEIINGLSVTRIPLKKADKVRAVNLHTSKTVFIHDSSLLS